MKEKNIGTGECSVFSGTCYGDYTVWGVECRKGERTGSRYGNLSGKF